MEKDIGRVQETRLSDASQEESKQQKRTRKNKIINLSKGKSMICTHAKVTLQH